MRVDFLVSFAVSFLAVLVAADLLLVIAFVDGKLVLIISVGVGSLGNLLGEMKKRGGSGMLDCSNRE